MNPLKVGTRVMTRDTRLEGTVRFCGEPQFAKGVWVGVELDTEQGKNDGEVKGVRYFQCKPQYGLFCKPEKLSRVSRILAMCFMAIKLHEIRSIVPDHCSLLVAHANVFVRSRSQP